MLISSNANFDNISIYDIQFATAIALDNMGENKAAKIVLELYNSNNQQQNEQQTDNLLQIMKSYNLGAVAAFIHALYKADIVPYRVSSLYKSYKYGTICRYIEHTIEEELYRRVMQIFAIYPVNELIVLYMSTDMWYSVFSRYAGSKNMVLSQDTIALLHDEFRKTIFKYSADGSYQTRTKNPNAFLMGAYNRYFKYKESYKKIVDNKSVMSATSDDDNRTLADKLLTDDKVDNLNELSHTNGDTINFMQLAEKIYEASISLFNHRNSADAYSDIFTWYQNRMAAELRDVNKKPIEALRSIFDIETVVDRQEDTRDIKQNARYGLCDKFSYLLHNGLSIEDIYPFFLTIMTEHTKLAKDGKNGLAVYEWGNLKPKKSNNSANFQKHYEGFLALRELLDFLNSPRNDTGFTIMNFPTNIFRKKELLSRFNNIYEYLAIYKDAIELVMDPAFTVPRDASNRNIYMNSDGLYHNDYVYEKMTSLLNKKDNFVELMSKAYNLDLSSAGSIVLFDRKEIYNLKVLQPIKEYDKFITEQHMRPIASQNYDKLRMTFKEPVTALYAMLVNYVSALATFKKAGVNANFLKNTALALIAMMDVFLEIAGFPVEVNGISQLEGRTIEQLLIEIGVSNEVAPLQIKGNTININQVEVLSQLFKHSIAIVFDGYNEDVDLETVFNISRILNGLLYSINDCESIIKIESQKAIDNMEGNYFLCYAKLMHKCSILHIPFPVKDLSEVMKYSAGSYIINKNSLESFVNTKDAIALKRERSAMICNLINDYLQYHASLFGVFANFTRLAKSTLKVVGNATGLEPRKQQALSKLSTRILCEHKQTVYASRLDRLCKSNNCYFDDDHYLKSGMEYVMFTADRSYIHKYGYLVNPGIKDDYLLEDIDPVIRAIDENTMISLEYSINNY